MKLVFYCIVWMSTVLFFCCHSFRRTAYSVGSSQVGFNLPKSLVVEEFKETWNNNPSGDGEVIINFSINEDEKYIENKCIKSGFKKLPIKETLPNNYIYSLMAMKDSIGYYKLKVDKNDERDYGISVLDLKRHKLYVYYVLR